MQFLHSFWYSCQNFFIEYPKLHTHIKWYLKNGSLNEINIEYNKLLSNPSNMKFLGIIIDKSLFWKNHVDMVTPKLSQACYTVRRTKPYLSHDDNFMIFFHSIMSYGLIFLWNSTHSDYIFKLQKKNH